MVDTVLRLPDEIAKALKSEATDSGLSVNTLLVKIIAERYALPYEIIGNRTPDRYFRKGELHEIIKRLLIEADTALSSGEIADAIIDENRLRSSSDLPEIRISISNILSGLSKRGIIRKAGKSGRANLWKLA